MSARIACDPYNAIITGVGGQGNVLMAQLFGKALTDLGFTVTVGDTYGAAQRGGPVSSHLRISESNTYGPLTPGGRAHLIVSLEPVEALRVIAAHGNPEVVVISNTRPSHPFDVTSGQARYPSLDEIREAAAHLSRRAVFVDASAVALELGAPVLTNTVMAGVVIGSGRMPMTPGDFESVLISQFAARKLDLNLAAFREGLAMAAGHFGPNAT